MRVVVQRGRGTSGGWQTGDRVRLHEDEIHHLKVRRAREGERIEVLDGFGLRGAGTLVRAGRSWAVEISGAELVEPPAPLTLAVAAGDRERFTWMVEKAAELGVTRIVPLETARTAGVATRLKGAHIGRLQRSAVEAIKQCGAAWAAEVEPLVPLMTFLEGPLTGNGWLADQGGDAAPALLDQNPITAIIGPEGGLTDQEREAAVTAGYRPVALGPHTLRFETAALAAVAAITHGRMRSQHG